MNHNKTNPNNKVLIIIWTIVFAVFAIYFTGYQLGKAYYYFTH